MRVLFRMLATIGCGIDDRHAGEGGRPLQVAALPFQIDASGEPRFLLITARSSGRWIIPKGWPVKGLTLPESAAREAYEEAGVRGTAGAAELGRVHITKRPAANLSPATWPVIVYPLQVKTSLTRWPEMDRRRRRWASPADAIEAVDGNLGQIILGFQPGVHTVG